MAPRCSQLHVGVPTAADISAHQATRNKLRTACLWGVRTRDRLMHDGGSPTLVDAIRRHANQAAAARNAFSALSASAQQDVLAFLGSL